MRDLGVIVKISRGVYQLSSMEPPNFPDFLRISVRIPQAVICLISALHYYGLSSQIPHKVYVALPQSAEKPRLESPPLDIIWLSEKVYTSGIIEQQMDGIPVKVYCKEKTIADCFKFRSKIGLDTALEALKDYLKNPDYDLITLIEYARIDRVEKIITPYLQALL